MLGLHPGGLFDVDEPDALARFVAQTGVTFPIAYDTALSFRELLTGDGISPFPLDVVIDREGRLVYVSREYDVAALRRAVERALE